MILHHVAQKLYSSSSQAFDSPRGAPVRLIHAVFVARRKCKILVELDSALGLHIESFESAMLRAVGA